MSELMLIQIQNNLRNVNQAVEGLGERSARDTDVLLGALDDMAANVLATQAIVGALLKKYPLDLADVEAWLSKDLEDSDGVPEKTLAVARYLVTGVKGE